MRLWTTLPYPDGQPLPEEILRMPKERVTLVHIDGFKSGTALNRTLKLGRRLRVNFKVSFFVHTPKQTP